MAVTETADARKNVLKEEEAWQLLQEADTVVVGKGKKSLSFQPTEESREELLKAALGRTGNLRAPTLRIGKQIYVGYNEGMYGEILK